MRRPVRIIRRESVIPYLHGGAFATSRAAPYVLLRGFS